MKNIKVIVLIIMCFLIFGCKTELKKEELIGLWKISDMKIDIPDVPALLIENAKILAFSSIYEFNNDMTYLMMIYRNELEDSRQHIGKMLINDKNLTLTIDTLLIEHKGTWKTIEKDNFSRNMFKNRVFTVESISASRLIISEKEANGSITYTLDRLE